MKALIFVLLGLAMSQAWAAALGLFPSVPEYSAAELNRLGFVEFTSARPDSHAPIAVDLRLNGERVRDPFKVFNERLLARLPEGQPIRVTDNHWEFPVGTMVAHELRFNDGPRTLFELRLVEKLDERLWGYGAYLPEGERLVLRRNSEQERKAYALTDPEGREMAITLATVPQKACARCHSAARLSNEPVQDFEEAGPCEFQPENASLRDTWARRFQTERGWNPFERTP